jgi:RNA polymerase sigma factor (TIGR02999 family)
MAEPSEISRVLSLANQGDARALRQVLAMLYDRLRLIARSELAREAEGHTLETDGLVHEAYLRLSGLDRIRWRDREHLLSMAARTMRRVLIDYADQRRAQKRGGGDVAVALEEADGATATIDRHADELHALDEALARLEEVSPRQSRIVECRFFGGMTVEETAAALGVSTATVSRGWALAQARLYMDLRAARHG